MHTENLWCLSRWFGTRFICFWSATELRLRLFIHCIISAVGCTTHVHMYRLTMLVWWANVFSLGFKIKWTIQIEIMFTHVTWKVLTFRLSWFMTYCYKLLPTVIAHLNLDQKLVQRIVIIIATTVHTQHSL